MTSSSRSGRPVRTTGGRPRSNLLNLVPAVVSALHSVGQRTRYRGKEKSTGTNVMNSIPRQVTKNVGAAFSKSAGKIYGKYGKSKMKKFSKKFKTQQVHVYEESGSNASVKCAHLIHHTHPVLRMFYLYCQSLTQYAMYRIGNKLSNWQDTIQDDYTWTVSYYANSGSAVLTSTGATVLGTQTFVTFSENIYNNLLAIIQGDLNRDILFADFALEKLGTRPQKLLLSLRDFKMRVFTSSHFKIQNRSRNALGSEADEVDNVPLEGTMVDNKGNGVYLRDFTRISRSFASDNSRGLTVIDGDGDTTRSLQEPLRRGDIRGVKKFSKIKLDPGELKTSILKSVEVFTIQKLKGALSAVKQNSRAYVGFGVCRIIGLEKMLATNAVGESAMSIFYELQQNYYVSNIHKPANQAIKEVRFADGVS